MNQDDRHLEVCLEDGQQEHFQKMILILKSFYFAIDLSIMGSGKTHITCKLFQYFGFENIVIVSPKSIVRTWKAVKNLYNLSNVESIITYETLRGVKLGLLPHGFLEKINDDDEIYYEPTEKLDNLIKDGCLFVFDEFQKTKSGDTSTHAAVKTLITRVRQLCQEEGVKSRVILTTGTMFCKSEQVLNFIKLIGIQNNNKLYTNFRDGFKTKGLGFEEIYNYSCNLDSELTCEVYKESLREKKTLQKLNSKNIKNTVYKLYTQVIQQYISSAMPPFVAPKGVILDCKNEYFILSPEKLKKFKQTLKNLSQEKGVMIKNLMNLENDKLEIFLRKTKEDLKKYPNCKIALIFNHLNSIEESERMLSDYNPLILQGSVKEEDREDAVNKFNRPDLEYRVFIGQFIVCSLGLDLHDTNGNFPRRVYISPNYRAMDSHQVTYRFFRRGIKSTPVIRYVYVDGDKGIEKSILDAYNRKKEIFEDTLEEQVKADILFPGQYPTIRENSICDCDLDIFDFDIKSESYILFSKYFIDLQLLLRYAIFLEDNSEIDEYMGKKDLKKITNDFNFKIIAKAFLEHFTDKNDESIEKLIDKHLQDQNNFFNKMYAKYIDPEFEYEDLWF